MLIILIVPINTLNNFVKNDVPGWRNKGEEKWTRQRNIRLPFSHFQLIKSGIVIPQKHKWRCFPRRVKFFVWILNFFHVEKKRSTCVLKFGLHNRVIPDSKRLLPTSHLLEVTISLLVYYYSSYVYTSSHTPSPLSLQKNKKKWRNVARLLNVVLMTFLPHSPSSILFYLFEREKKFQKKNNGQESNIIIYKFWLQPKINQQFFFSLP